MTMSGPQVVKEIVVPDDAVLIPIAGRVSIRVTGLTGGMYGSLHLPHQSAGDQNIGEIAQVYEPYMDDYGNTIEPMVQIGDIVIIGKFTGTKVDIERESFIICRETDILACLRVPPPKLEATT